MAGEMMNLQTPLEKAPAANFLREMTGFAAGRLIDLKAGL